MFVDIDYKKKITKAKMYLAKPNKEIISPIIDKFGGELSLKLGNISELTFSIPYFIEDKKTNLDVKNPQMEIIKEKMLILVTMGTYKEWFIIDAFEEDVDDTDNFVVTAFSLGFELKGKRISGYEIESANAREILETVLENQSWSINYIDPMFEGMYRSFESGVDGNVLDCVIQLAETFGCLIIWDSDKKEISLRNFDEYGKFRGLTVNYGKYLKTLKRSRTTDEMVTRLWIFGNEDISIHGVNPTGQGYVEDFGFFMFPFERDENRNVIKKSDFMSDELCHAILDNQELIKTHSSQINALNSQIVQKRSQLIAEESKLDNLNSSLENILELLDTAKAVLASLESEFPKPDTTAEANLVKQRVEEKNDKESEISAQELVVGSLEKQMDVLQSQLNALHDQISNQANFTEELQEELKPFIIEQTWRDDNYINENELYQDGLQKFLKLRMPKVVIEASIENLMNIIEEQYYWDKLVLGEIIKVKYPQLNIEYTAKIIEISFDLENNEANLTIANTDDLLDESERLVQLLYKSQNATTLVQNNKYKWNRVNAVTKQVSQILENEWDANKNKIIAGVNNSIEVGNRGIIIKNPDIPNEIVIMQAGIIALSKDGGETWKTAIKPDGIVAERLIGQIIAGSELLITNSSGSFTLDDNGAVFDVDSFVIRSKSGGGNIADRWTYGAEFIDGLVDDNIVTPYEKKRLKLYEWVEISDKYQANKAKIDNYFNDGGASKEFVQDYYLKYNSLYEYLFVIAHGDLPLLADQNMSSSTRVNGEEFRSKFRLYESSLIELEKQLDIVSNQLASKAIDDAKKAQENINELMDDIAYKIEMHSSNGFVFKNGRINTVITARVYRGAEEITSKIPKTGFIWIKTDENGNEDIAWNRSHVGVGNKITIDRNDVSQSATFECRIDI